jgi:hypothetical protein
MDKLKAMKDAYESLKKSVGSKKISSEFILSKSHGIIPNRTKEVNKQLQDIANE